MRSILNPAVGRPVLYIMSFVGLSGCGRVEAPLADFKAERAYYGWVFEDDSDHPGIQIVLTRAKLDCNELDDPKDALWLMVSGSEAGDYQIDSRRSVHALPELRLASASHDLGQFSYTIPAGLLTLDERVHPSSQEGVELRGNIHAFAPLKPYASVSCSSGIDVDSGEFFGSCECESQSGKKASCETKGIDFDCCSELAEDYWELDIRLAAEFCPKLCVATSWEGYSSYCSP